MSVMNSIDKFQTAKRVQQALRKDPNNVEALLQLATMLGTLKNPDLTQKRKVLNRILSLEPTHQQARAMLFDMDRAAIGGNPARLSYAVILTDSSQNNIAEKPLVLRYSIIHQILVYLLMGLTVIIAISIGEPELFSVFGVFLFFLLIPLWFVSVEVQVDDTGLLISRLFGAARWEIPWNEIKAFQPAFMGQGIKLIPHEGKTAVISSQVFGYFAVIEILRQRRPDLFDTNGMKIFRKGFFTKYRLFFFLIPATPMALGAVFVPPFLPGIIVAILVFFLWRHALNGVYLVKVDENRLLLQSFRKKHELTAQQIKNITMVTRYNRRGVATNFIQIETSNQTDILFNGFPEGNEIIFGLLRSWWGAYQNT